MKRILLSLAWLLMLLGTAHAQAPAAMYCFVAGGGSPSFQPCSAGNPLSVSASITPSGTQNVNITQFLSSAVSASNPLLTAPTAATGVGASTAGAIAPNNTTAVVVKASAGTLYGAQLAGLGSAPAYVKIYNATSATCGSGTPVKRLMIPAASTAANGAGSNISFGPVGVAMTTGITYCVTTGIADNDTTAPAAATFLINIDYQ